MSRAGALHGSVSRVFASYRGSIHMHTCVQNDTSEYDYMLNVCLIQLVG